MKERVLTGSMIFLVIVFAILARVFSVFIFDGFVLALMILSALESSNLFAKMNYFNNKKIVVAFPPLLYGLFLILMNAQISIIWSILSVLSLIIGLGLIAIAWSYIFKNKTDNEIKTRKYKGGMFKFAVNKAIHTVLSLLYPAIGLFFFVLLNHFADVVQISSTIENKELIGLVGIMFMFVITTCTDIFSMLVGKTFGKRQLAKNISPNKTIEGSIGGFVFSVLISMFLFVILSAFENFGSLFYNIGFDAWKVLVLSGIGALVSICGDLFESFLKRKANVKDTGNILPGHGGFLDRFDSHAFNVVWVFLFFLVFL